jgi:hypothetical protein
MEGTRPRGGGRRRNGFKRGTKDPRKSDRKSDGDE